MHPCFIQAKLHTCIVISSVEARTCARVGLFARTADRKTTQWISFRGSRGTLFVLQRMQVDATGAAEAAVVLLISSGPNRRFKIVPGVIVAAHYRLTGGQGLLTCIPDSTNLTKRERERESLATILRFVAQ